jgi:hypothetical protein
MKNDKVKKKRGDERKDHNLHIRGTKSQIGFLDILSYEADKTKTEVIWEALDFWYHNKKGVF